MIIHWDRIDLEQLVGLQCRIGKGDWILLPDKEKIPTGGMVIRPEHRSRMGYLDIQPYDSPRIEWLCATDLEYLIDGQWKTFEEVMTDAS